MKKISALAIAGVFTASLAATAFAEMAEVKVGGEIRVRDVITNNYDLDGDLSDRNNTVTERTRINVDAKIDETTKAFIQLQDTKVLGSEASTTTTGNDTNAVDVKQAYLELDKLFGQPLSLKLGRQTLEYGDQRLIGSFDWSNYGRSFDALKLVYNTDVFSVDLWTAKVLETGTLSATGTEVGGATNEKDGYFNGLYATVKSIPANTLDLYLLEKKNTVPGEDMLTYGLRLNGGALNIDWTAEAAWQGGDANATQDKDANMYTVKLGYTIPEVASLRIGGEYDFASGQDDSADDTAFDQLYPTNHPLYGVSDWSKDYSAFFGDPAGTDVVSTNTFRDIKAWSLNVSAKPAKGLKLLAEYWNYETDQDDLKIGSEANIQAWYAVSDNVSLHAFWARFMPGDDLKDLQDALGQNDDPADNVTLQVAVKF